MAGDSRAVMTRDRLLATAVRLTSDHDTERYRWSSGLGPPLTNLRQAAVLVPLFIRDGEVHVWLTRRSQSVSADKGHVAFPGGMRDPGDADESATCLREAEEEVGLRPDQVQVVGLAPPSINLRGIFVSTVIGIVDERFTPTPNEEVDLVFHLPLKRFLSDQNHRHRDSDFLKNILYIHYFEDVVGSESILTWGLTANLCLMLAVGLLKSPTSFAYNGQGKLLPDEPFKAQMKYVDTFKGSSLMKL